MQKKLGALTGLWLLAGMTVWAADAKVGKVVVDKDREAALANPYANDLGPKEVDVTGYPKDVQAGYKMLQEKCSKCHQPTRPLNAQFLELKGDELAAFKKQAGAYAKDENLYKVDDGVWKRYVKRMASKPGCELSKTDDQKVIYKFLVHDSKARKMGDKMEGWVKHRKALLAEFKEKNPKRYAELYEGKAEDKKKR